MTRKDQRHLEHQQRFLEKQKTARNRHDVLTQEALNLDPVRLYLAGIALALEASNNRNLGMESVYFLIQQVEMAQIRLRSTASLIYDETMR